VTIAIDTEAAASFAQVWSQLATVLTELQFDVEGVISGLQIGSTDRPATRGLADSAARLWQVSSSVLEAVDAVHGADQIDLDALFPTSGLGQPLLYSPGSGELGQTYQASVRSPWTFDASSDVELGLRMAIQALIDTAANEQIRSDEFQIVSMDESHLILTLPGVIDLSDWLTNPRLGTSETNASVRDTDQSARPSFGNTSIGKNRYAQMVAETLERLGVPPGTEIAIVGHSHGADTALDLAASEEFNGPGGYHVSHVLAVGYDSAHQLGDVPDSTKVLALENTSDLVVMAEKILPTSLADGATTAFKVSSLIANPIATIAVTSASRVIGIGGGDDDADDSHPIVEFSNFDVDGIGHRQSTYIDFLERPDSADVAVLAAFLGTFGASMASSDLREHRNQRRRVSGTARAIDVSVPDS
jgi:hypothetical protein